MKYIKRPRYSKHPHSFKLQPHTQTSYALLTFVTLVGIIILGAFTLSIMADQTDPVSGNIHILTTILGQPPASGAVISTPIAGQHFADSSIQVNGTCVPRTLVKVYKNNILAGTALCNIGGHFAVPVSLFNGANTLSSMNYDGADQPGPVTAGVAVIYDAPPTVVAKGPIITPLLLTSTGTLQSAYTGDQIQWPIGIQGGVAPYAIYVTWGDGTDNVYSRAQSGTTLYGHSYDHPGPAQDSYQITITATDAIGNRTSLVLTGLVRSRLTSLSTETVTGGRLLVAWPAIVLVLVMVACFWFGELLAPRFLRNQPKRMVPR